MVRATRTLKYSPPQSQSQGASRQRQLHSFRKQSRAEIRAKDRNCFKKESHKKQSEQETSECNYVLPIDALETANDGIIAFDWL
jgi:hypothetical protein